MEHTMPTSASLTETAPASKWAQSPKPNTVLAGWICFALGFSLMFASLGGFIIFYGPLFLATFILSIVAMAQRQIAAGVVMLVTVLAIPPLTAAGLFMSTVMEGTIAGLLVGVVLLWLGRQTHPRQDQPQPPSGNEWG